MPSRIIKESICTSESLVGISADAERLFWRLVVKADDFGLFYGNPRIMASLCFPLSPPKEQRVREWLNELICAGMVGTYGADDGKTYLKLMSWDKHQQQRAQKSKFPLPIVIDSGCNRLISDDDSSTCNQMQVNVLVNVNENVNEKRGTRTRPNVADGVGNGFDQFWNAYPRRVGKQDALKAWNQLNPDASTVDKIIAGIKRWKASALWMKDGGNFICYPATFLRGRRWEEDDRPDPLTKASAKNYDSDEDFMKGK